MYIYIYNIYIYIYIYIIYIYIHIYIQYSLQIFFKYRRSVRKSSRGVRATLSMVPRKSLGIKCRKVSPSC